MSDGPGDHELVDAVGEFVLADGLLESQRILLANPQLMSDEADALLVQNLAAWPPDSLEASVLTERLQVLRASRSLGIALAVTGFSMKSRAVAAWPAAVADLMDELTELSARARDDPTLYTRVITLGNAVLRRLDADRLHRALLLGLIGDAYAAKTTGDRTDNLSRAAECYMQALRLEDPREQALMYAMTQNALGVVLRRLPTGDLAANSERGIAALEEALRVLPADAPGYTLAEILNNLANAYLERRTGDRAVAIERAIDCYEEAAQLFDPETAAREHAQTQNNLGQAYEQRLNGDRSANLDRAIACYRDALRYATPRAAPMQYAATQYNLGRAYASHAATVGTEVLVRAIECHEEALRYWTKDVSPLDHAAVLASLGVVLARLAPIGEPTPELDRAVACLEDALRIRTANAAPDEHLVTAGNLGLLHFSESRWSDAHAAFASAITALDRLYDLAATAVGRRAQLGEVEGLVPSDAYCLARLGRISEAVEQLERGRTRALAEVLGRERATLEEATAPQRRAFETARTRIRALAAEARDQEGRSSVQRAGRSFVELSDELAAARGELSGVIAEIRNSLPEFMAEGLGYAQIAAIATATRPLLYLLTTTRGSLALVVAADGVAAEERTLWLDCFTAADLTRLLWGNKGEEVPSGILVAQLQGDVNRLEVALERLVPLLRSHLMQPVAGWLRDLDVAEATVVPVGRLSLLPLAAAAPEDIVLAFTPSARSLQAGRAAAARHALGSRPTLLAITNPLPLPDGVEPLAFAQAESQAIEALFGDRARILSEQAATRQRVVSDLEGATHLHLACHGSFDFDAPLDSGLLLAGHQRLTLRDLLGGDLDLSSVRLVVLSACQTGITEFEQVPDESIGLPAGFHQAGVPGVVSTLWSVNDVSTAVLVARLYRLMLVDGLDPAGALHRAQQFLRTSTAAQMNLVDWYERRHAASGGTDRDAFEAAAYYRNNPAEHPFADLIHWAGFVFTGS